MAELGRLTNVAGLDYPALIAVALTKPLAGIRPNIPLIPAKAGNQIGWRGGGLDNR